MISVIVRYTTGKEYRMIRDTQNSYYFIRNIFLCNNPDIVTKKDSNKKIAEFLDFWEQLSFNRVKEASGLFPVGDGMIVADLMNNNFLICIKEESGMFGHTYKNLINLLIELGNCKQYKWIIPELLRMKDDIKKLGFKISAKEEKEWDYFLKNFSGKHHIKVENA